MHAHHLWRRLQAQLHLVGLFGQRHAFALAGDLVQVPRLGVVADHREQRDGQRDEQPHFDGAAHAAVGRPRAAKHGPGAAVIRLGTLLRKGERTIA